MSSSYSVWLSDSVGNRARLLHDYLSLDYVRTVNQVTPLIITLPYDRPLWNLFTRDARIEVFRSVDGGIETLDTETCWLVRKRIRRIGKTTPDTMEITALCATHLLTRRIVAYAAGSSQAEKTATAADDMLKAIVSENLLVAGDGSQRNLAGYVEVGPSLSLGPAISKSFAWRSLLHVMQELSDSAAQAGAPVYFDMTYGPDTKIFTFATYVNQRGADRRPDGLTMGPDDASLINAEFTEDWTGEITAAYAGGSGQESSRAIGYQEDTLITASPLNRIESFLSDTRYDLAADLEAEARALLRANRPRTVLAGKIQETPQKRYGVHWKWGDVFTAAIDGQAFAVRADSVRVHVEQGHDEIAAYLRGESP